MDIYLWPSSNGDNKHVKSDSNKWLANSDAADHFTVAFRLHLDKGIRYLKVATGYQWNGSYLSCNNNGYLGLYPWSGAVGWALADERLLCQWNGQPVCLMSDGFYRAAPNTTACTFSRIRNENLYQALGL